MEALPRRHRPRASGSTTSRPTTSTEIPQPKDRLQRPRPATGSATRSTSAPTATASTTCSPTTPARRRSSRSPSINDFPVVDIATGGRHAHLRAGRLPAPVRPRRNGRQAAQDRRRGRPASRRGRGSSRGRSTSATPASRRAGARAVFEFRGEIVTVPAEKGDPRNLTNTAGVHERGPAWSPDGKSIAYFSDAGGEYRLARPRRQTARATPKTYDLNGRRLLRAARPGRPTPRRSPSSTTRMSLFWIDLAIGKVTKIASEPHYGPCGLLAAAAGLVAGLEVDRLHPRQQGRVPHRLRLQPRGRTSRPP